MYLKVKSKNVVKKLDFFLSEEKNRIRQSGPEQITDHDLDPPKAHKVAGPTDLEVRTLDKTTQI